jgi:hypothetical protein
LKSQRDFADAAAEFRALIRLKPDDANAHYNLGIALNSQGKTEEAMTAYRAAIRLKPDYPEAHCNLGFLLLHQKGECAEALTLLRRGHELGARRPGWRYPSAQWVREAEQSAALEARLPTILRGESRPADASEAQAMARLCFAKEQYGATARLYAAAFDADPELAHDPKAGNRSNAARAAALAGCGQGKDDPPPDVVQRTELRQEARAWLEAELAAQAERLDSHRDATGAETQQLLTHWKSETSLAGVRDPEALAKLPEAEREAWRSLWSKVDALLTRARVDRP